MAAQQNALKFGYEVGKGIMVTVKGKQPTTIVAVGAAACIVGIGAGLGYATYLGGVAIRRRLTGR